VGSIRQQAFVVCVWTTWKMISQNFRLCVNTTKDYRDFRILKVILLSTMAFDNIKQNNYKVFSMLLNYLKIVHNITFTYSISITDNLAPDMYQDCLFPACWQVVKGLFTSYYRVVDSTNLLQVVPTTCHRPAIQQLVKQVTAICVQAQTANIFARLFTFETGRLPLETEMFHCSCDVL
jgi:hypothetical protein